MLQNFVAERAEGTYVYTTDGSRHLDMATGTYPILRTVHTDMPSSVSSEPCLIKYGHLQVKSLRDYARSQETKCRKNSAAFKLFLLNISSALMRDLELSKTNLLWSFLVPPLLPFMNLT